MDTKKKRSGGFGSIFFMIIIIGIVWAVIAQMSQRTSNYKYKDFESDLKSGRITDVVISQNAEVPTGTLTITFTDGSKIWVNSGSKVIYPAQFTTDSREIFIEGEIYLDIVHDEKRPFIVKTRKMEIRDLGTQFCVSAYNNDANSHVVLVKGKVEIETKGKRKNTLSPNQLFLYDNKKDKESVHQVNTQDYVAWKDGYYQFNHQKLDTVLEKLCKYYGIKIHWDEKVGELTCSGKLDLKENPEKVLNALQNAAPIKVEQIDEQIHICLLYTSPSPRDCS